MARKKCTLPNWSQALIARGVGLDPAKVVVRHEDDHNITFLQHMPRKEFLVSKDDGQVIEC